MQQSKPTTAIFIMPASSRAWVGSEGLWITTAGWAAAAKRILGDSVVVTQDRIASAEELLEYPLGEPGSKGKISGKFFSMLPTLPKLVVKDILLWKNSLKWNILDKLNYNENEVAFVWEKHDLFSGHGIELARKLNVPYVNYVHAPVVWEASKWGVKRYIWGRLLEKREAATLKKSDFVAAVSEEVKSQLIKMGVAREKIFVSPMAVDPSLFKIPQKEVDELRRELGLMGKWVIGWTGSFRGFHGLDDLINGFKKASLKYPNLALLLVGDGAERAKAEKLVSTLRLKDRVIFTGKKRYINLSKYISVFDMAVVSAKSGEGFHYSPQKLRDYMAAGKPVLAPNAGEIPKHFQEDLHLKLFSPGDYGNISKGIEYIFNNREKSRSMASEGQDLIFQTGTWDHELEKTLKIIKNK